MELRAASPGTIYLWATAICLVAPALGFVTTADRTVWSYVLLGGVPLSMMAVLLAAVHRGYRLFDRYSWTAMAWTLGATLILMPLETSATISLTRWARAIMTALVAALFVRLVARAWQLPWRDGAALVLGFGAVALFFGYRAGKYVSAANTTGLEAAVDALAEFFIDALVTSLLLLPAVVWGWIVRQRGRGPVG
jgi:hypothetical protein